jgi:hypothetical protein
MTTSVPQVKPGSPRERSGHTIRQIDYFGRIAYQLRRSTLPDPHMQLDGRNVIYLDLLPPHWQDEASTIQEWFIRYARAYGIHARYDEFKDRYTVRLTKDAADEATITWPGKREKAL